MADSTLLKYARARDDAEFKWRIAAAMSLKAQEQAAWELEPASRRFTDWVLKNPMVPLEQMVAAVAVNPTIAGNVTITTGAVSTAEVPDSDIIFVVGEKWDAVADQVFGATPVAGASV